MRRRRKGHVTYAILALLATPLLGVGGASAAEIPDVRQKAETGEIPADVRDWLLDCPNPFEVSYSICLHVKAYEGELKLGSVKASIDEPIELTMGAGIDFATGEAFVVPAAGDSGSPQPVKISGGILGVPELDPLIDAEPLGLLSLSATPQLGEIGAGATLAGGAFRLSEQMTLPLSIKLNNTLFGDRCQIGTPEEPITIELTRGTTEPPAGFEPMVGNDFDPAITRNWGDYSARYATGLHGLETSAGSLYVDNTFEVPGAKNCDLLPAEVHSQLEDGVNELGSTLGAQDLFGKSGLSRLAGRDAGIFDTLINQVAGLPSEPGNNHMRIRVDVDWVNPDLWFYSLAEQGIIPHNEYADGPANELARRTTPAHIDFESVEIGSSSATQTVVIENVQEIPLTFSGETWRTGGRFGVGDPSQFEFVMDDCEGTTLQQGESCELSFRFSPTEGGFSSVTFVKNQNGFSSNQGVMVTLWGTSAIP